MPCSRPLTFNYSTSLIFIAHVQLSPADLLFRPSAVQPTKSKGDKKRARQPASNIPTIAPETQGGQPPVIDMPLRPGPAKPTRKSMRRKAGDAVEDSTAVDGTSETVARPNGATASMAKNQAPGSSKTLRR